MPNQQQATIIFVRGLPGSGKTVVAQALQQALFDRSVIMLDPDAIDYASDAYLEHVRVATAEGVDSKIHAYRFLRAQAYQAIAEGRVVIWNQPFTNLEIFNKLVANLRAQADEVNTNIDILAVEVAIDPRLAQQRIALRKQLGGHGPSEGTFERFVNDYESFSEHGYRTIAVRGDVDVSESVGKILEAIQQSQT